MNSKKPNKLRVAAIGDLHVKSQSANIYKTLFEEISQKAEILVLCGDLTDLGTLEEAELLSKELKSCRIPIVGVLGNHDHQSDNAEKIKDLLMQDENVHILDLEPIVIQETGFVGVKGYIGGFGAHALASFGEPGLKQIIKDRDNEAFTLENQLKALSVDKKVVIMHYSPIRETVVNEPCDIIPFLGSTRYEQTIDQYGATVVFHGHANMGPHSGKTSTGIPVYNVAYPLMQKISPNKPYALIEL